MATAQKQRTFDVAFKMKVLDYASQHFNRAAAQTTPTILAVYWYIHTTYHPRIDTALSRLEKLINDTSRGVHSNTVYSMQHFIRQKGMLLVGIL